MWATRSIIFRRGDPGGPRERRRETGAAEPFRPAREIDWVSWLAEIPEQIKVVALPKEPPPAAAPAGRDVIEASGNSLRVSLKIRHTI